MSKRLTPAIATTFLSLLTMNLVNAGALAVPNASFEGPPALFPSPNINSWQKTAKPDWYDEGNAQFLWTQLTGVFRNQPPTSTNNYIDNCDGLQAMWLFAVPEVGLFQDYDSLDWNDTVASHDFNAQYEPGKSYVLTVGVIGTGGNMSEGATMALSLYYRDAASNHLAIATTSLTNVPSVFSNNAHFVDCRVAVPTVKPTDAWAGQNIGIQIQSTVSSNLQGGYWDLDNVRLVSILAPTLINPIRTNGQFQFTAQSEPGLVFEILAGSNLTVPATNWTTLALITNVTGTIPLIDTDPNFNQRFYQARQLP